MELDDIRNEVRIRAGVDGQDAMAADSILTSLVNASIREVANMRDWDWLVASETINTVVDTDAYARDALAKTTIRVEDVARGELLRIVTPRAAARYNDISGRPVFWHVEAGQLVLVPTPSEVRAIKHVYIRMETALSGDTDEPLVPDYAINLVIVKAALRVAARMDNTSQYRLLADEERDVTYALQNEVRRGKGAPTIDSRRDWTRRGGII